MATPFSGSSGGGFGGDEDGPPSQGFHQSSADKKRRADDGKEIGDVGQHGAGHESKRARALSPRIDDSNNKNNLNNDNNHGGSNRPSFPLSSNSSAPIPPHLNPELLNTRDRIGDYIITTPRGFEMVAHPDLVQSFADKFNKGRRWGERIFTFTRELPRYPEYLGMGRAVTRRREPLSSISPASENTEGTDHIQAGLYGRALVRLSDQVRLVQHGHLTTSISEGLPRREAILAVMGCKEISDQLDKSTPLAYNSELLLLALLAFRKWPHLAAHEMPLVHPEALDMTKWAETIHRLQSMGMLKRNPDPSTSQKLTGMGHQALAWLSHVRNWRVACFLAYIKRDMPVLSKRVFVRLAAIIEFEVPITVKHMSRDVMDCVWGDVACGPAASMVDRGQLWVALSLWERLRRQHADFAGEPKEKVYSFGQLTLTNAAQIRDLVLRLEAVLQLPPATDDEMDQRLSASEMLWVQVALASAWVTNLIQVPRNWSQTQPGAKLARCAVHGSHIWINEQEEVISLSGLATKGRLHAIVLEILEYPNHVLEAENVVVVDKRALARIAERMGTNDFRDAVVSTYAQRA